jgi:hypothetical protein
MRASACILVLCVLVAACRRHPEAAASSDEGLQKKLAGVWVCEQTSKLGQDIIDTIELSPDGTYAAVHRLPNRQLGPRTIEESGTWAVEEGILVVTQMVTSVSEANAQGQAVGHMKIVRFDARELEVEGADKIEGVSISTNRLVFRRQAR